MWSESTAPWNNVLEKMKLIARKHNHIYLYYYYPHIWNINGDAVLIQQVICIISIRFFGFISIIIFQQVDATRTGLSMIHSKIPVDIENFNDNKMVENRCNWI